MAINGIHTLTYGVGNVAESARFFEDFGLVRDRVEPEGAASFTLPEGSRVVIRHRDDPVLPATVMVGDGVREVIWGVDTPEALDGLVSGLSADREVTRDEDGAARFVPDFGIPMGLQIFDKKVVVSAPDPVNSLQRVNRLNQHRKWRRRALPKLIAHVVFAITDYEDGYRWMRDRLNFRLTESQAGFGKYLRADGTTSHHTLLLINADAHLPGLDGKPRFHHANFGVEDIDEMMVGANYMMRRKWPDSHIGLGRHRIDSALFYYIPCPAGGEAEYGTDTDHVDDSWVPRHWPNPLFAYAHFVSNLPPFLQEEPDWTFEYITEGAAPPDPKVPGEPVGGTH